MQIHNIPLNSRSSGHALLITLGLICVLMVALSGSMMMVNGQYRSTIRSQDWNAAIPVTEAGIEEAMSHLNHNCMFGGLNPGIYQPVSCGWAPAGASNNYSKSRTFSNGAYVDVTIDLSNSNSPVVFSKGYMPKPFASILPQTMFATLGSETAPAPSKFINRNVRVTTRFQPLFKHALAADGSIDLSGQNVETDSFNSTTDTMSTNGRYDKTKRNARGDVASNTNLTGAVSVGNANILGTVSVGPGGSITIGANGTIGDRNWVENGGVDAQPGHTNSDMNVYFPDVEEPFTSGLSPLRNATLPAITGHATNTVVLGTCSCSSYATIPCCVPAGTNGTVLQATETRTTTALPTPNSYNGSLVTNWTTATSTSYPSGTTRNIVTNTVTRTSEPYVAPSPGSYSGSVTINFVVRKNQKDKPAAGFYEPGTLSGSNNKWTYTVKTYTYQQVTDYTYDRIGSYSYALVTGYQRVTQVVTTNVADVTYNYVFDSGSYTVTELSGKVLVRGNAKVYCKGNVNISGQDSIIIQKNASLVLFVTGASTAINGKGLINEGGSASAFNYYGLPSNKNISIGGNGQFTGTIYAPEAHLALGGGGSDSQDFIGAAIVGSAKLNGHFKFHFDESLEMTGPARGYVINSWREE